MILVVDDDLDLRETLCEVLAHEGYTVAGARNGAEALNVLRQPSPVCLVLLDLMMPVMSGYQFLQERKVDPELAKVPVVVMSARWEGSQEIAVECFMRKPVPLTTILSFAERYCPEEHGQSTHEC